MNNNQPFLTPFSIWKHRKTGSYYLVLGTTMCSTNGPRENKELSVSYISLTHQRLRHREVTEFFDGRFEPVPPGTFIGQPPA